MPSKFDSPPRDLVQQPPIVAGLTARFSAANTAELYYDSLQYEGLASWEAAVAIFRKKPREIIPLFKVVVETIHSFVWGGARFPRITISPTRSDDSDAIDDIGPRLWDDDALALTTFTQELMRSARLDRAVAEYSRKALVTTSVAVLLSIKSGRLNYYVEDGKHCQPTWRDDNPRELASVDICYQFERQEQTGTTIKTAKYWFRRIIDDQNDTVFQLVPVTGAAPVWTVDAGQSVAHGLGFCPVIWVRTLPMSSDSVDGCPVIDPALYKMLDRINYVYSMRGRSVEYGLDPQWVRKNVSEAKRQALAKTPGKIWDISDEKPDMPSSLALIEANGSGAETAATLLRDLRQRFTESCRVVIADSEQIKGKGVSGVVLEYLHAPMIALASDLRKDLGDDALGDLINLALRMIAVVNARGEDIYIQGVGKACKLMATAQAGGPWLPFPIKLQWGRFFSPSVEDIGLTVQAANQAKQGGLVSKSKATQLVADLFAITDVGAEVDTIDTEAAQQVDYGPLGNDPSMSPQTAPPKAPKPPKPPKAKKKAPAAQVVGKPKP